ncbi:hypothetical protein ACPXB3_08765 [Gordonia sp. DT219]|uniref:hypothetical protein n=1 Tax=Gordonia sp. DT219 TaxID=3416658 RepID=UPI003CF04BD7
MNRLPVMVHRLTAAVIGLACIVIGIGALGWQLDITPIKGWVDALDPTWATTATAADWWWAALLGAVVVALVWGVSLLGAAARPGKVDDLILTGSGADGILTVPPKLIAAAVADELSGKTMFDEASVRALDDRGRSIIRIDVTAPPRYSYGQIAEVLGPAVDDIRRAVDGADIHVQALVHLRNQDK